MSSFVLSNPSGETLGAVQVQMECNPNLVYFHNLRSFQTFESRSYRLLPRTNQAAGMVHSMAITEDGALFYWVSSDPHLRCQQLYSLCEKTIVSISAGKYWAATATAIGDVYMWDGKKSMDKPPVVATRLHRVKGKKIP
ncbi:uncharacterized protein [Gossypium hirsutum]|uniref:Uncharacterized protein isoform X1 n=4 Tax=Gossypium TaxID=3633 RepID=A0ABM2ZUQ4_GOSHI|nr:uncharacterized protein LOC107950104 isoform X1 [Gossypium hirsutum]